MARRTSAAFGAALAVALLLSCAPSEAQDFRNWSRRLIPKIVPVPSPPAVLQGRRPPSPLPNYYLDRDGPVTGPILPLGPGDIANSLRSRGFNSVGPVQRRGNTSITEAVGPAGERVQLVIGPSGEIVGARVLNPPGR
jgi:hypothetical protein